MHTHTHTHTKIRRHASIYNVIVTQTQPTLLSMPPFIYTTDSPDILFDSFALGSIPEPETPKPTHDCTHNRVRKYPSIPASHPLHTYIYVPNRTTNRQCPISSHSVGYMIIRGYPRRKNTQSYLSLGEKHIPHAGTCLSLWTGPWIHLLQALVPKSYLRSSRSCRSTSSPALRRTLIPSSRGLMECSWMGAIRSGAGVINTSASPVGSALPSSPVGGRGRKPCEPN